MEYINQMIDYADLWKENRPGEENVNFNALQKKKENWKEWKLIFVHIGGAYLS